MATSNSSPTRPLSISVRLDGPTFANTYPLKPVVTVLYLFDQLVTSGINSADIPTPLKRGVRVVADFPNRGSYEIHIALTFAIGAIAQNPTGAALVSGLIEQISTVIEAGKALFSKGGRPTIRADHNGGVIIEASNNKGPVRITVNVARDIVTNEREFGEMFRELASGELDSVRFSGSMGGEAAVDHEDVQSFEPSARERQARLRLLKKMTRERLPETATNLETQKSATSLDTNTVELTGEIVAFDKQSREGIFRAEGNHDAPDGEYAFALVGEQATEPYIVGMLHSGTKLACLRELSRRAPHRIVKLQALSVETARTLEK